MEKADILEMTVNFLYMLNQQRSQATTTPQYQSATFNKPASNHPAPPSYMLPQVYTQDYSHGYQLCEQEMARYFSQVTQQRRVDLPAALGSPLLSPPTRSATVTSSTLDNVVTSTPKSVLDNAQFQDKHLLQHLDESFDENFDESELDIEDISVIQGDEDGRRDEDENNNNNAVSSATASSSSVMWRPW